MNTDQRTRLGRTTLIVLTVITLAVLLVPATQGVKMQNYEYEQYDGNLIGDPADVCNKEFLSNRDNVVYRMNCSSSQSFTAVGGPVGQPSVGMSPVNCGAANVDTPNPDLSRSCVSHSSVECTWTRTNWWYLNTDVDYLHGRCISLSLWRDANGLHAQFRPGVSATTHTTNPNHPNFPFAGEVSGTYEVVGEIEIYDAFGGYVTTVPLQADPCTTPAGPVASCPYESSSPADLPVPPGGAAYATVSLKLFRDGQERHVEGSSITYTDL